MQRNQEDKVEDKWFFAMLAFVLQDHLACFTHLSLLAFAKKFYHVNFDSLMHFICLICQVRGTSGFQIQYNQFSIISQSKRIKGTFQDIFLHLFNVIFSMILCFVLFLGEYNIIYSKQHSRFAVLVYRAAQFGRKFWEYINLIK